MNLFRAVLISLRVWIDTFHGGWSMVESTSGRFYVLYGDGRRSRRFHYRTARDYAGMFGGDVVHLQTERVVKRWNPRA